MLRAKHVHAAAELLGEDSPEFKECIELLNKVKTRRALRSKLYVKDENTRCYRYPDIRPREQVQHE